MPINFDGGNFQVPPELLQIIEKGAAYRDLEQSDGYRKLLDFLESRSNQALIAMRESKFAEDRVRARLQDIWQLWEEMIVDVEKEVQRGIAYGRDAARELTEADAVRAGAPMVFGDDDDGE